MPPKSVTGKTCLITGAASGIGRATALATAERGGRVVLTDIDEAGLNAAVEAVQAGGGTVCFAKALDISDYDAVAAMAHEVHTGEGSVDVVMNIAGTSIWGAVESLEHRHWQRMIDVNLMGPIHVIESFLPETIAAGRGGHLVNVSSAAGLLGLPWHAAYSASKFGLRGISEVLRFDLRRHDIGVSLVCPGGVDTGLVDTMEIVGVNRDEPRAQKLSERFRKHAAPPEHVAEKILRAIERDRYLVYTSWDVRAGHFFERRFSPLYRLAMRGMNDRLVDTLGALEKPGESRQP